jgi:hypothetical protein
VHEPFGREAGKVTTQEAGDEQQRVSREVWMDGRQLPAKVDAPIESQVRDWTARFRPSDFGRYDDRYSLGIAFLINKA